ncbi:substrate-binding domain-containing protein [Agrobacterium pusense]|uniref:Transcriptional regulatory protein, LacI family n=1 Tax=Agrobacterium pusense TaxID=648995 RepID=U4PY79_9HYPH|nr:MULTISPECIES: LacI family DNA-binding transcriptional regulator [Agrobacterium]MBW9079344.1 LacI family DNA-binding transcriptional regulator [Agrobacterium pusense]MCJ2875184.1 LacI family DNA-binding transcriptional regulator [Agrobacterium pusense]MDH0114379.1 LacI family DNA-binding transcriptional regulator [Agrobacterium pusense]QBJ14827.1 LacI family DNA-binding transcriptional regulator [Agrobacterium sp. 33MFTa1.1]QCL86014.1 substrate-binding domain-containing protein [Agrobacteriu
MKPTVHDIAERAGVSLATIDRVLNMRPGVHAATRARVEAAIAELGYVRDIAAANLAKGRNYSMIFILPGNDNSFMATLRAEVRAAASRSHLERTAIRVIEVPPFNAAALTEALEVARREKPSGVAFVATDSEDVAEAADRLAEDGIATVTLVSDLSGSRRDHYAGVDNVAAGRTAASLMGRFLSGRSGDVAVVAGSMLVRDHRERLEGFRAVIEAEFPQARLLPVLEGRDDPLTVEALVREALGNATLAGIYSLGAGNRGLIRALGAVDDERPLSVIAHELTETTANALRQGLLDAVLNQDAGHEVRSAIRVLKARADGLPVIAAQERIRIDIFLRDNLP